MAITKTDVLNRFEEFSAIDADEWTAVLGDAALQVNTDVYKSKANLALVYLTAHLLGMAHPGLIPQGRITAESMDGTDYRYAVANHADAAGDLDTTPYGRMLLRLKAELGAARFIIC